MTGDAVEVVNIIGSGTLRDKFDILKVLEQIDNSITRYDPEMYHGMYIRFSDDSPLITLYGSGKYIITGAKTTEELHDIKDRLLELSEEIDLIEEQEDRDFAVQNVVCTANLDQKIDLNKLSIYFGLESIEYEPEQFPGLVYRPENHDCVVLIFSSGKIVLTGCDDVDMAERAYETTKEHVEEALNQ
jgi:transcription initiation factor TFIID TATA-box-binding protein